MCVLRKALESFSPHKTQLSGSSQSGLFGKTLNNNRAKGKKTSQLLSFTQFLFLSPREGEKEKRERERETLRFRSALFPSSPDADLLRPASSRDLVCSSARCVKKRRERERERERESRENFLPSTSTILKRKESERERENEDPLHKNKK